MLCLRPPRSLARCLAALNAQNAPQADTVDASLPTQLPRTAVPHHYALTVTPHADRLTFDGDVAIDLEVVKPTRTLVLNAADLKFASATLRPAQGGAPLDGGVTVDAASQTATITFPRTLAPGCYRLELAYSGKINTQANGLFALDYKNKEGKDARSLFTQFEAADARRFVPSWDEPDYKATLRPHRPRSGEPDGGQQHAGRIEQGDCRRPQGSALPDHADDVVLPAVLRERRFRADHQAGGRARGRHRDVARQRRQGPVRARRRGADPALLQRLFRNALPAAQAR